MENNECWLCVNADGTEIIRNRKPKRYFGTEKERETERLSYDDFYKKNIWISDYDHISNDDFPVRGMRTTFLILPSGTIEKILGHPLTWDDDAVKI